MLESSQLVQYCGYNLFRKHANPANSIAQRQDSYFGIIIYTRVLFPVDLTL